MMEDRIISEFNAVLGTQVENISKGHELFEKYLKNLNEIETKVSRFLTFFALFTFFVNRNFS